jgi:hypothetical protein
MKRAEIEEKIATIIHAPKDWKQAVVELTDLFIELSNERCIDQRMTVDDNYHRVCEDLFIKHDTTISDTILNAPLPEIN